ncbi:MAG TPA: arylesterase [Vicinamibacterales bacterium]|jgi:acyl-CoA thioesterase-1|nr:arylesterase [Vicinamibacterales bacterium]
MTRRIAVVLVLLVTTAACSRERGNSGEPPPVAPAPPATASAPATPRPDESSRPKVVVLGDSLTAGLGLAQSEAYPALIEEKLRAAGYDWDVVNAGESGDTSAAGLARADWALDQPNVRILVLELGANDGLRGLPVDEMKKNLGAIIEHAQARHAAVLLAGMEAPPNFGPDYTVSFRQAYRDLAKQYKVTLLPFLLDKVAGNAGLNQGDGIHPNVEGARIVADNVWTVLRPMVASVSPHAA